MKKLLTSFGIICFLSSCAGAGFESEYPKSREELESEKVGKLTGEEGLTLFGGSKKSSATEGINVNSYLWRATLDTVYIMPLISADPFGGTVLTDWYRKNDNAKEKYKLNIFIIGGELRSDAIRVSAFKQVLNKKGVWEDATASPEIAQEIENKILLRAREIKFNTSN